MIQNIPSKFNPFPVYYNNGGSPEPPEPDPLITPLTFTGKAASNSVCLSTYGSPDSVTLQYSKNGGEWTNYSIKSTIQLNEGQTVAFSGNNAYFNRTDSNSNFNYFVMNGTIEANGNIQSLLNFSDSCTDYCYKFLFYNCSSLVKAPALAATTLATGCYQAMFNICTSLSTAPQLPVTTLAPSCYYGMFTNCTAMSGSILLPATTLVDSCYGFMFDTCTSLSSVEVNFIAWNPSNATSWWFARRPDNRTFIKPAALPIIYDNSHIPSGWTIVNK